MTGALEWLVDHNIIESSIYHKEMMPLTEQGLQDFAKLEEMGYQPSHEAICQCLMGLNVAGITDIQHESEIHVLVLTLSDWANVKCVAKEKGFVS